VARKPFLLRLPPDLYEDLERWAADELRSVNAQIEYLLREQVRNKRRDREGGGKGGGKSGGENADP
jgi:hypothetical protein